MSPPTALRLGSLCTGYGGLDMAVQHVFGGHLAWVADNDPGASRILAHHHPHVPNLGDITATDWTAVPPVDVVLGGYPCQPFSTAGQRKGTEDDRHIWPHIADALGVLRPRLAVFENVAGHLSLGFDTVLADLAALGFDARWGTVRASDVGAAHQRNRLFFYAWPADTSGQGLARRWAARAAPHRGHLAPADAFDVRGDRSGARGAGRDEPAARRLAAADTDRRGLPGNAERHGRPEDGQPEREPRLDTDGCRVQRAASADAACLGRGEGRPEPAGQQGGPDAPLGGAPHWGEYGPAILRWESASGRTAPGPTDSVGRLSPAFVEWLMGLPAGHVTDVPGLSRTAQLKALGNGVVPQQAARALLTLLDVTRAGGHATAA
ncbi:DNA cytosine methyltransferase [Streptomyces kutzneri]|uniref:DNA cytosine methyltransferase n=1 Tax=Streptomyces kutzneri TaxID=3051179 RepID=UPI0028D5EC92|nr:DNA cytosine methyltransferase [Streptomyces sp. DSM 40907]